MENWYPIFRTPLNFLQQMFGPIVKLLDCFRKQTDPKVRNPWVESRKNCLCDPLFNTILQERAESPLAVSQLSNGATINAAPLSVKTTRFPEKQFIIIEYSNYKKYTSYKSFKTFLYSGSTSKSRRLGQPYFPLPQKPLPRFLLPEKEYCFPFSSLPQLQVSFLFEPRLPVTQESE